MKKKSDRIDYALVFKALSNENRLRVFQIIRQGHGACLECRNPNRPDDIPAEAVCVCEILDKMNVTAPTLSHHLKELRFAGLVEVFNRGQWSYYIVREGILAEISDFFTEAELVNR